MRSFGILVFVGLALILISGAAAELVVSQHSRMIVNTTDDPDAPIFVDDRIGELLSNQTYVDVMVKVKDTSDIILTSDDTHERTLQNYANRKKHLDAKTSDVLVSVRSLEGSGIIIGDKLLSGRGFSASVTHKAVVALQKNKHVKAIYFNEPSQGMLAESRNLTGVPPLELLGFTGAGQSVCVLDSGIDYNHSSIADGCFDTAGCRVRAGYDFVNTDVDPMDDYYHGTLIAGVIASNHSMYRGIAPGASLIALKVLNQSGTLINNSHVTDALSFCLLGKDLYNISVVSISIGSNVHYEDNCSDENTYANDEINDLYNIGVPVVVASGNSGVTSGVSYPACAPNTISVGATYDASLGEMDHGVCPDNATEQDMIACFTNREQAALDLLAPGCAVASTSLGGGFAHLNCGTSMAAPVVSGAIVLMKQADSSLMPEEVKSILQSSGVQIVVNSTTNETYKRVNIEEAIRTVRSRPMNFTQIYANSTQAIFKFSVWNYNLNGTEVNWTLDTGEQNISSTNQLNLSVNESGLVFIESSYNLSGSYVATAGWDDGYYSYADSLNVAIP